VNLRTPHGIMPIVSWIRYSGGPISSFLDPKWEDAVTLPLYGPGYSGQSPLETSDCAAALQTSVLKARLVLLEIERVKRRTIISPLEGNSRQLDELLAAIHIDLSESDISCPVPKTLEKLWWVVIRIGTEQHEGNHMSPT
jgi:hypothetical protein